MAIPDYPIVFPRWPRSMVGHDAPIVCPRASGNFDYEAELAIVIGAAGRHISKAKALDHVAGYACFNDGSLRDYQFKSSQWAMGKNFDASGSFGPDIVTADELPPGAAGLRIMCRLCRSVIDILRFEWLDKWRDRKGVSNFWWLFMNISSVGLIVFLMVWLYSFLLVRFFVEYSFEGALTYIILLLFSS